MNTLNKTSFMSPQELAENLTKIRIQDEKYPVGGVPLASDKDYIYVDGQDTHTVIYGSTGSKKSRLFAMPTTEVMLRAGESFVVTDPKGEICTRTYQTALDNDYKVSILNLRDLKAGTGWNPMLLPYDYYHAGKKTRAIEMIGDLARAMIGNQDWNGDNVYWMGAAEDVILSFLLMTIDQCTRDECNIRTVLSLWEEYKKDRKRFSRKMNESFSGSIILNKFSPIDCSADKTAGSIESIVSVGLNNLVINEELLDFLSVCGESMEKMVSEKLAIYLITPDESPVYNFIVSIFISQFYEVLIKKAQASPNGALENRVNFIVDEFGNLPTINNMDAMITASRSRNIRFYLIVQNMGQLKKRYKDAADIICGNCDNWIYLYTKEYELLNTLSRLCGEVIMDNGVKRPLISEFELQHLSKSKGQALVLSGRNYPCIVNLPDIDEYPFKHTACNVPDLGGRKKGLIAKAETLFKRVQESSEKSFISSEELNILLNSVDDNNRKVKPELPKNKNDNFLDKRKDLKNKNCLVIGVLGNMIYSSVACTKGEVDNHAGIYIAGMRVLTDLTECNIMEWYWAPTEDVKALIKVYPELAEDTRLNQPISVALAEKDFATFKKLKDCVF